MLSVVEKTRLKVSRSTDPEKKSKLGQYFTPVSVSSFIAGLFPVSKGECRLLDAGAGIGSLSSAFLDRCATGGLNFDKVQLKAFEIDQSIHVELDHSLSQFALKYPLSYQVIGDDFIERAVTAIQFKEYNFTHAILNPPYKKISSESRHRYLLREVGIETVNLYSAFVALAISLMAPEGQVVAIIPRSFCNGPYYRPFREFILNHTAVRHIHLFESRNKAFKDEAVLQENVIIRLERDGVPGPVMVSTSTDDTFEDLVAHEYPIDQIVFPDDKERFIHVPTPSDQSGGVFPSRLHCALSDIGVDVSTGPVVDFRLKEYLRAMPDIGSVPLLYPAHFGVSGTTWPIEGIKKPNAILLNSTTEKWFYPNGFYCVVRRFSSKEELRRIVASVADPNCFGHAQQLGFENHLNVFHERKKGLPEHLARGLAVYLNSTLVDEYFRRFNGHTQVNATDLKQLKYPDRSILIELGKWAVYQETLDQSVIDIKMGEVIA